MFTLGGDRIALADPLRRFVSDITGLSIDALTNGPLKEKPLDWIPTTPRRMMQTVGTEWGRESIDDQIWLKVAFRAALAKAQATGRKCIVIPDVRFENEARFIREEMGGVVVHVTRPGMENAVEAHVSENALGNLEPDFLMENNGTYGDWVQKGRALAKSLKESWK